MEFLNQYAALITAGAAIIQAGAAVLLYKVTRKYVKASEDYAKTSRKQLDFFISQERKKEKKIIKALSQELSENIIICKEIIKAIKAGGALRQGLKFKTNKGDTISYEADLNEDGIELLTGVYINMRDHNDRAAGINNSNTERIDKIKTQLENLKEIIDKSEI